MTCQYIKLEDNTQGRAIEESDHLCLLCIEADGLLLLDSGEIVEAVSFPKVMLLYSHKASIPLWHVPALMNAPSRQKN